MKYPNQYLEQKPTDAIPNGRGQYRVLGTDSTTHKGRMFIGKRSDGEDKKLTETTLISLFNGVGTFIKEVLAGDLVFTILRSKYYEKKD